MSNTAATSNRPSHIIFAVESRGENQKSNWTEIGAAWTNKDGSLSLNFKFMPTAESGVRLQLRENKPRAASNQAVA